MLSRGKYLFPLLCSYAWELGWLLSGTRGNVHLDSMSLLRGDNEPEERQDREIYQPNGIITFGILNAGGIPVLCNVGVNVFH